MVVVGLWFRLCFLDSDVFLQKGQSKWKKCWIHDQGLRKRSSPLVSHAWEARGTSRPLRLSIGTGCSTFVVVCCCFCCRHLAVFWLCIPVPIQTRERDRGAKLSPRNGKYACDVCAWKYHDVSPRKSHPRAPLAESHPRWLASHHFPFPRHEWTSWAGSTACSYK